MKRYHTDSSARRLLALLWLSATLSFVGFHANASGISTPSTEPPTLIVELTGLEDEIHLNVMRFLSLERYKDTPGLEPRKIRQWFRKAKPEILAALQPYGYYQPIIDAKLDESQTTWVATFVVNPGPITTVNRLNISVEGNGADLASLKLAIQHFSPKEGDPLDHSIYKVHKQHLYDALFDAGYLDTRFEKAAIHVTTEKSSADIDLIIHTGPQYFFGETTINQSIFDDKFISKYVIIPKGEPFNTQRVINQKLVLDDSQYFSTVEPFPLKEHANEQHQIPIDIQTTPRKPRRYTAGFGFGTDTGPRINAGIEFRRVNRLGHKVDTGALVSPVVQNANLRYRIPFKDVRTDEIALRTRIEVDHIDENTSERTIWGIERGENWHSLRRRLYIEATFETFETDEFEEFARVITPGIEISYQKLNNALFPTRGYRWLADWRFASPSLHSTVEFTRYFLSGGAIFPTWENGRFLIRSEAGYLKTTDFSETPPLQRFYAGGARSVRGYGYRELGPLDDGGSPIGGSQYIFGSLEIDSLEIGNFGWALFVDAGSISSIGNLDTSEAVNNDDHHFDIKSSAGIGFRWKSPVGMLRLDVSAPLQKESHSYQFHFSIGPDL